MRCARSGMLLLLVAALAVATAACGGEEPVLAERLGEEPPPLATDGTTWLNVDDPLTLAALRGKAVYLEFGFLH